jgi:hypothetical protein
MYRHAVLMDRVEGKNANPLVQSYSIFLLGGRPRLNTVTHTVTYAHHTIAP